ncbi:hypothetical protein [Streptomyces prunicolor]|uniref:hypothetical protein n=1 Tax=Streptomyces prunicolor TaxID=67348 RepID=UPI0033CBF23E
MQSDSLRWPNSDHSDSDLTIKGRPSSEAVTFCPANASAIRRVIYPCHLTVAQFMMPLSMELSPAGLGACASREAGKQSQKPETGHSHGARAVLRFELSGMDLKCKATPGTTEGARMSSKHHARLKELREQYADNLERYPWLDYYRHRLADLDQRIQAEGVDRNTQTPVGDRDSVVAVAEELTSEQRKKRRKRIPLRPEIYSYRGPYGDQRVHFWTGRGVT